MFRSYKTYFIQVHRFSRFYCRHEVLLSTVEVVGPTGNHTISRTLAGSLVGLHWSMSVEWSPAVVSVVVVAYTLPVWGLGRVLGPRRECLVSLRYCIVVRTPHQTKDLRRGR